MEGAPGLHNPVSDQISEAAASCLPGRDDDDEEDDPSSVLQAPG